LRPASLWPCSGREAPGAGRVARAFVTETAGVFREHWTIEQVAEQFDEIESTKNLKVFQPYPSGFMDHLEYSFKLNPPSRGIAFVMRRTGSCSS
jgi:hypothetical protein